MERAQFVKMIARLAQAYGLEFSRARADAYWEGLEDIDPDDLAAACRAAVRESKFFPTVAELRDLAGHRGYQPGDGQVTPMPDFRPAAARRLDESRRLEGPPPEPVLPAGEGIIAWKFPRPGTPTPAAAPMTAEQEADRKAVLRAQLEMLQREGKA